MMIQLLHVIMMVSRYQSLKELILSGKSDDFNALYDEFINYSSIAHEHEIIDEDTDSINTSSNTSINTKSILINIISRYLLLIKFYLKAFNQIIKNF